MDSLMCEGGGLKASNWRIIEYANSVDPDAAAYCEPPHLDLHCFPSIYEF